LRLFQEFIRSVAGGSALLHRQGRARCEQENVGGKFQAFLRLAV
jgi:hypothetical protein